MHVFAICTCFTVMMCINDVCVCVWYINNRQLNTCIQKVDLYITKCQANTLRYFFDIRLCPASIFGIAIGPTLIFCRISQFLRNTTYQYVHYVQWQFQGKTRGATAPSLAGKQNFLSVIWRLGWKFSDYMLVLGQKLHIWTYDRQNLDVMQKHKNYVVKCKTKSFKSTKCYFIKMQAILA